MSLTGWIVSGLLTGAVVVGGVALAFGGKEITMGGLYDWVRGRWPYVIAVAGPVVTAAHGYGYLTDGQFSAIAALGGAGAVGALRGSLKTIVAEAIAKKVEVQLGRLRRDALDAPTPSRPEVTERRVEFPPPIAAPPRPTPQTAGVAIYEEHDQS